MKKIPVGELGVIIFSDHIGYYLMKQGDNKKKLCDIIEKRHKIGTDTYKILEKNVERKLEKELEVSMLKDLKKSSGNFGCFNQIDSLKEQQRKTLRKIVEDELESFKECDFPIALEEFLKIEETIFKKYNSKVKKYPILKRLHDYVKEYNIPFDIKDFKIIPKDFAVQQSVDSSSKDEIKETNSELMKEGNISVDHNQVKNELMKLLLGYIQNSYSQSSIYKRLHRLESSMMHIDQIEFCEGSKTIFDYIIKHADLNRLFDLFTNDMVPVLYTIKRLAFSNEELVTLEEFEKIILENHSFSVPNQKLKENIDSLFEFLDYVRNQDKERERFNTHNRTNFYYESETMFNGELDFKYQKVSQQDDQAIIKEINISVPDGKDIASTLNWNECYAPNFGDLQSFLIKNEIHLKDNYLIAMDQSIIRLDDLNENTLDFDQLTTEQISCYILKRCIFKSESTNLLIKILFIIKIYK